MTPSQEKRISQIKELYLYYHSYGSDKDRYEVKKFEVNPISPEQKRSIYSVVIEVGLKGDEGTTASIYCRNRNHFFIGRRGKIEVVKEKHRKGTSISKRVSLYEAVRGMN